MKSLVEEDSSGTGCLGQQADDSSGAKSSVPEVQDLLRWYNRQNKDQDLHKRWFIHPVESQVWPDDHRVREPLGKRLLCSEQCALHRARVTGIGDYSPKNISEHPIKVVLQFVVTVNHGDHHVTVNVICFSKHLTVLTKSTSKSSAHLGWS